VPNIANITFWPNEASNLCHIAMERVDLITHVKGHMHYVDTIPHRCFNTTNITICTITTDLSGLSAFNLLRSLEIHDVCYASSNFKAVLHGVGHSLTDLKLVLCWNVDPQDIIALCPSLANLRLIRFSILYLHTDTPLDHLCGLVVRVLGYRTGGPGSIPGTTRKKVVCLERGPLSLVSTTEELFDKKVAAPV
jgi:hypothetical protein